ncbi:hypothetical protein SLEP1_g7202 [Rubroshorea leprosula]|uniref:RBR-type E3 ubiquitin transferase n=1 Tax=Rubroshorea leprosula TaxID=152421 RepID=A0AAV5I8K6_9ROSI|nr:hypothetical protein SLEP1_g7202 [Rubroshorea leprosula]
MEGDELTFALEHQRRELLAAKAQESDLDVAFDLQMQEAITASLSLHHPSTSRNPIASPPPGDIKSVSEDDGFDYLTLLLGDISRFQVERRDHERCEEEMRQIRENLSLRIHDQKFAAYIMTIPEDEWKEHGDNYENPFNGDVGLMSENFKVYAKGLVSEERIRDMKVMVAGAGVAVCDSRDNVVLEANKPLESAELMSSEKAELEALVHGLNVALSLDLKRVTIYLDDYMVYQYVTGRVQPSQSATTLVNEVVLLQRKFTYCQPSLVSRNDFKFAFKLARDAIVSQISWRAETSNGKNLKETCVICFEDIDAAQMFTVDGCFHRYCFSCMRQHVEVKLLNGMLAKCPDEGCKSEVSIESCGKFLDPKLVEIMSQRMKEASIAVEEKVYCPFLKCSALMSRQEVLEYTKTVFVGTEQSGARKCKKCHRFFCINCRVPWHYNLTCYDYKRSNPPPKEDALLSSLAREKLWRQCKKCYHMVELKEGCYHITCRCQYEFCYTCGAEWKNKGPTCKCPIWDERNIIRNGGNGQQR